MAGLRSITRACADDLAAQKHKSLPHYMNFEQHPKQDLSQLFSAASPDTLDMLAKLLLYDPMRRLTAHGVSRHAVAPLRRSRLACAAEVLTPVAGPRRHCTTPTSGPHRSRRPSASCRATRPPSPRAMRSSPTPRPRTGGDAPALSVVALLATATAPRRRPSRRSARWTRRRGTSSAGGLLGSWRSNKQRAAALPVCDAQPRCFSDPITSRTHVTTHLYFYHQTHHITRSTGQQRRDDGEC